MPAMIYFISKHDKINGIIQSVPSYSCAYEKISSTSATLTFQKTLKGKVMLKKSSKSGQKVLKKCSESSKVLTILNKLAPEFALDSKLR